MSDDNLSRRNFLAGLATTGTVAALANAQAPGSPDAPVVVANHAVVEPKPSPGTIKIVCAEKLATAEVEQIRAAGKNIDLRMLSDRSELKHHVADAEVILGVVDSETMLAAKKL